MGGPLTIQTMTPARTIKIKTPPIIHGVGSNGGSGLLGIIIG